MSPSRDLPHCTIENLTGASRGAPTVQTGTWPPSGDVFLAYRKRGVSHESGPGKVFKTGRFGGPKANSAILLKGEVQKLLEAIETSTHTGLRDRALLGGSCLHLSPGSVLVCELNVEDSIVIAVRGKRFFCFALKKKAAKQRNSSPSTISLGTAPRRIRNT